MSNRLHYRASAARPLVIQQPRPSARPPPIPARALTDCIPRLTWTLGLRRFTSIEPICSGPLWPLRSQHTLAAPYFSLLTVHRASCHGRQHRSVPTRPAANSRRAISATPRGPPISATHRRATTPYSHGTSPNDVEAAANEGRTPQARVSRLPSPDAHMSTVRVRR